MLERAHHAMRSQNPKEYDRKEKCQSNSSCEKCYEASKFG